MSGHCTYTTGDYHSKFQIWARVRNIIFSRGKIVCRPCNQLIPFHLAGHNYYIPFHPLIILHSFMVSGQLFLPSHLQRERNEKICNKILHTKFALPHCTYFYTDSILKIFILTNQIFLKFWVTFFIKFVQYESFS